MIEMIGNTIYTDINTSCSKSLSLIINKLYPNKKHMTTIKLIHYKKRNKKFFINFSITTPP